MVLLEYLRQSDHVIAQQAGTDLVLFHLESGQYYSLNELGARIWELCDGSRSLGEVVDCLECEYDAPRQVILDDCLELVASLKQDDLLAVGRVVDEDSV
jgi:hypothetical protein